MHRHFTSRIVIATLCVAAIVPQLPTHAQTFSRWSPLCEGVAHTAGIALGDLDGDGDLDAVFATGRHLPEQDWVYSNDGHGSFYGKRALGGTADPSYGVALGDLDGDGALDAVIANDIGAPSVVYRNDGRGHFAFLASLGATGQPRRAVALGDFDKDGDVDIVLVGMNQDHLYFNDGAGRRWTERALGSRQGNLARATGVAVADLDADNDLDVVIPGRYEGDSLVYMNDGKGNFGETRVFGTGPDDPTSVAVGDVDGDGDPDIVTANWEQPHVVYANDGRGRFSKSGTFGTGNEQAWAIVLGDIDLDGDLDAIVGNANINYWNDDLDGDGRPDRFGQEARGISSRVYVNNGRGQFTAGASFSTGNDNTRPIAVGDVDRDGDLDVLMGNDCQPNYVFFNSLRGPKMPLLDPVLTDARQQWSRAAQTGDKVNYTSFLSDDATWVDFTGMVGNKTALVGASPLRATGGELDVRHYASGAVILGVRGGGVLRHVQVWVRNGERWLMAATQEVRVGSQPIIFWPPMTTSSGLPSNSGVSNELQAIQATLLAVEAGIETRDLRNLTALTTPEFVAVSATGQMRNRDDWTASLTQGGALDFRAGSAVEANATRIHGELAISNRVFRSDDAQRFIQTLVWVKQNGKWALAAVVTTSMAGSPR